MNVPELLVQFAWMIPVVMALVEVVKKFGVEHKFLPIWSVAVSEVLVYGYAYSLQKFNRFEWALGLLIGLAAVGLYSGSKNVVEGLRTPE